MKWGVAVDICKEVNDFYYHMALYELQAMSGKDCYNGLSYNSILYLNVIDQIKDCTVSKVAEALRLTKSAVTLKVAELERQGLLKKRQSEQDKRVYYLTVDGSVEHAFNIYDDVFRTVSKELETQYTEQDLELFCRVLRTLSSYEWKGYQKP